MTEKAAVPMEGVFITPLAAGWMVVHWQNVGTTTNKVGFSTRLVNYSQHYAQLNSTIVNGI